MKFRLLILLAIVLSCGLAHATVLQSVAGSSGATSTMVITITSSTTGSLIAVLTTSYGASVSPSISDNNVNTYTVLTPTAANSNNQVLFYHPNTASGVTTLTVLCGGTDKCSGVAYEISGIVTSSPVDVSAAAVHQQTSNTSWASNAVTTTVTDTLLGMVSTSLTATASYAASGSWTNLVNAPQSSDGDNMASEQQVHASASAGLTATGTSSSTTNNSWIVSFKEVSAAAAPTQVGAFVVGP